MTTSPHSQPDRPDDFRDELRRSLGHVPPAAPGARERALHRATIALRQSDAADSTAMDDMLDAKVLAPWKRLRYWICGSLAAGAVAVVVLAALVFTADIRLSPQDPALSSLGEGQKPSPRKTIPARQIQCQLIAEMERTFPGILKAVVLKGGEVNLQLQPEAGPEEGAMSQAVAVTIRGAGEQSGQSASTPKGSSGGSVPETQVLTYSGRRICVNTGTTEGGGETVCFTALISGDGKVFVMSDDGVSDPRTGELRTRGVTVAAVRLQQQQDVQ